QNGGRLEHYKSVVDSRMSLNDRFPSNINPNMITNKDMSFLNKLIKEVKGLNDAYLRAGSPEMIFTNRSMDRYYAVYDANSHKVFVSDRAFMDGRTNFDNASTLFHEFFHGMQYNDRGGKLFLQIQSMTNNQIPSHDYMGLGITNKAAALMEMQAYYYEALMGNYDAFYIFSQWYNDINNGKYK